MFPGLDLNSHVQASLGTKIGGLGLRRGEDVALAAALSSKIMAEPKVAELDQALSHAGLIQEGKMRQKIKNWHRGSRAAVERVDG